MKDDRRKRNRLPLTAWLGYLLVTSLLLTGVTFSRYVTGTTGGAAARVASGGVTVTWGEEKELVLDAPADQGTACAQFPFSVSNGNSEVAIRCDVVVTLDRPLPEGVTIALYKNDDSTPVQTFGANGGTEYTFSNVGSFPPGSNATDRYCLTFAGEHGTLHDNYEGSVSLSVQAEQID